MEVDFTDKIKQCKAYHQDDDHKPLQQHDMNCPSCGCSLGKMYVKYGTVMATNLILPNRMPYASNMFANEEESEAKKLSEQQKKNLDKNKDGKISKEDFDMMKKKKAASYYDDEDEKKKKKKKKDPKIMVTGPSAPPMAKAEDGEIVPPQPKTKGLENPRNQHEYDVDRDVDGGEQVDLSQYMPKTKGLENPRNMNEYYKNLYRKVKGLD